MEKSPTQAKAARENWALLETGEPFFAHIPPRTYWMDIGTPARYLQAHHDMLASRVTRFHLKDRRGNFDSATHSQIDELSIVADDCTIWKRMLFGAGIDA